EALLAARLAYFTPMTTWQRQWAACEAFVAKGVDVQKITCPTLVLHGDADRIIPIVNGARLAAALPSAHYVVVPGGGHLFPLEDPARFASPVGDHIAAWNARLPQGGAYLSSWLGWGCCWLSRS